MTYQELATRLISLGQSLQEHASQLSGEAAAKAAKSLGTSAEKLEKLLQSAISQCSPEALNLRELLDAHSSILDTKKLQAFAKKLGLKSPGGPKATPAGSRQKFVELAILAGVAEDAQTLIEAFIQVHRAPKPDTSSEESLRAELRRLGAKPAEEIEMELEVKFTDDEARALGKAAGIKVTAKSTKKALIPKIVHFAQRNYENTAMVLDA